MSMRYKTYRVLFTILCRKGTGIDNQLVLYKHGLHAISPSKFAHVNIASELINFVRDIGE